MIENWFKLKRSLRIGEIVLAVSLAATALSVLVILSMSWVVERKAVHDLALDEARQTSRLVFEALYSAMSKGWDKAEIQEITDRLNASQPDMHIQVVRGQAVISQYGDIPGEKAIRDQDPLVQAALADGKERLATGRDSIRYVYPVLVQEECQRCHEAPVGAVNGVVDVAYPVEDLKISLGFVINTVIIYFAGVLLLLSAALYAKLRFLVVRPVVSLAGVIKDIIQHTDLNRRVESRSLGINELDELTTHFNRLLDTVQDYQGQLEDFSIRDPLTRLYNRRKFEEFVRYEVDRAARHDHSFSLVMLDLDNFKHINDTFGHPVGDLALKELAMVLNEHTRHSDVVARLGGDEFAVLLPETPQDQGVQAAEKLRQALNAALVQLPVGTTHFQASLGVVSYPDNGETYDSLSVAMDIAMYRAKRAGKNRVVTLDAGETAPEMEIFGRGQALRDAIAEGRIIPFYQPIVALETGQPVAYEVLARLSNADGSVESAGAFMPVAEELDMTAEIDAAVFEHGLRDLQATFPDGDMTLYFNLSSRSMADPQRLRALPERIRAHGLDPRRVVLEITEREALPHFRHFVDLMHELRAQGLRFALDDFGSGFSSFLYLKYLEVDVVKIEGSFVRHVSTDEGDKAIVDSITMTAKRFGLRTVAEFVEDEAAVILLRDMGIDYGQGYHLGRPSATLGSSSGPA